MNTKLLIVLGLALAFGANYWLHREEVSCDESGGVYVRSVFGYKCIEVKTKNESSSN